MTESNGSKAGSGSSAADGDLVSLVEAGAEGAPASSQDSILNAAHVFEAQLEQMSTWKHQLAQQMEIMRRDGIKLLERQKSLAVERKRLADEREALVTDRQQVEKLQAEVGEETKRLRDKETEIEAARVELSTLDADRQRWERELAAAQHASEALEKRRLDTESQLAAAATRLQEIQTLTEQRGAIEAEIAAARQTVADLEAQQAAAEESRHALTQKEAEMAARERSLTEQEARHLSQDVQLRESMEQLEEQRKQLVEAQRDLVHETGAVGAKQDERWNAIEARAKEIAANEEAFAAKAAAVTSRDEQLRAEKRGLEETKAALAAQQEQLLQQERALVEHKLGATTELENRVAAAEKARKQAEEERQTLLKQRQELEKKLDGMETELTSQLEMLAKQTKRLTERRADLETRSTELEGEFQTRLARETETLREELARSQRTYEQRATFLQQQIDQNQAGTKEWAAREAELRANMDAAGQELQTAKQDLARITGELANATREKTEQAQRLAQQIARYEQDAADWQKKLEAASTDNRSAVQSDADREAAAQATAALKSELEQTVTKLRHAEEQRQSLEKQLAGNGTAGTTQADALAKQVDMLDKQRNDLAAQLFEIQDTLRRQTDEALLAKNSLEGELHTLRRRQAQLEAERTQWQAQQAGRVAEASSGDISRVEQAQAALGAHHDRLLRQARTLRAYRKQVRETKGVLEQSRHEIAQQREQLRSRKDNLEQVKRLLEKQEMVMARKLANHNALKTVAAVGIFVIMVLGSVFIGVYKFVNPIYRSEAVVQLVPSPTAQEPELQTWLQHQADFIRSEDVTFTAWKMLRTPDEHYGMHDVREEWLGSLAKNLTVQLDPATKTLAIRYTGPNPEGVSQVCNALATAYATPTAREGTSEQGRGYGVGATVLAKASPPIYPAEDNRLMLSLSVVAIVLFFSLLMVIVFRHYVARQLREIDQMADDQDLEDIRSEMPAEVRTA